MNPLYPLIAQRAGHRCEYCHAPEVIFNFPFEVEHILPSSRQGTDDDSNLALACRSCNLLKSFHIHGIDDATSENALLFHPRQDRWEEHFQISLQTAEFVGLTPIGRATVQRLRLNGSLQVEARRLWIQLGLFP